MIKIYTDGAYHPVLSRGGWGAVIVEDGKKSVFSGTVEGETTSNRMEITAALEGILSTPSGAGVVVYTDSQYLFGCMSRGWKRKANLELWDKLDKAAGQRRVRWEWMGRNTDNPFHKEAHDMANNLVVQGGGKKPLKSGGKEAVSESSAEEKLTHIDEHGRPRMVDVLNKPDTHREAVARGLVMIKPSTLELIKKGDVPKGDVLAVAQMAGIMAAKQTPGLIPLCHPILIGNVKVDFDISEVDSSIEITATVKSLGKTGVEMEALTAVSVAALTIYDMCKAVDKGISIDKMRLIRKSGGKSGEINLE